MFNAQDDYLLKSIRADENDYWRLFILLCTRTVSQQYSFPLRMAPKDTFTVTGTGVYPRATKQPQYAKDIKKDYSKPTSTTLVTKGCQPPVFGFQRDTENKKLVGVLYGLNHVLLTKRFFIYDSGTVGRPYDFNNEIEAQAYFDEKASATSANRKLYSDLASFKEALPLAVNTGKHNEVLARVKWGMDDNTCVMIATDNLESRLIAQDRARILKKRLQQQAHELGVNWNDSYEVPIRFYAPKQPNHLRLYGATAQKEDQEEARRIIADPKKRDLKHQMGDYEYLLGVDNARSYFSEKNWQDLIRILCIEKKYYALAWSLLEKYDLYIKNIQLQDELQAILLTFKTESDSTKKTLCALISLLLQNDEEITLKQIITDDILRAAAKNPELLSLLLNKIAKEEQLSLLHTYDQFYGNTVLHEAVSNAESLHIILALYPEDERLSAVLLKNHYGKTVMHEVVSYPESLRAILELLPEQERLAAVNTPDRDGNIVLHWAADNPQSLHIVLALYSKSDRLAAIQTKNDAGDTVLNKAASNSESLHMILALYPEDERLAAVQAPDKDGHTILQRAASNSSILIAILKLLPEGARLTAVQAKNWTGACCDTALHMTAAYNPERLRAILELLPKNVRLTAVQIKNAEGDTAFHRAAMQPESSRAILELLPEQERLAAVKTTGGYGNTVLHEIVGYPKSLRVILELLPKNSLLPVVQTPTNAGDTVLRYANVPESLSLILALYPKNERLGVIQIPNKKGNTLLHDLGSKSEKLLRVILESLPEEVRFAAIQTPNKEGNTILHEAESNYELFCMLQELLPGDADNARNKGF